MGSLILQGADPASSYGRGSIPRGKHQCMRAYQVATFLTLADTPLVKASHMANSRLILSGVDTGRHVSSGAIF